MPRTRKRKQRDVPARFEPGFIARMDGRTRYATFLRDRYDAIVTDLGGADAVGHIKAALVERFVWLEAILQTIEVGIANEEVDPDEVVGRWIQAVNALSGLATKLGIERVARDVPNLREYAGGKRRGGAA